MFSNEDEGKRITHTVREERKPAIHDEAGRNYSAATAFRGLNGCGLKLRSTKSSLNNNSDSALGRLVPPRAKPTHGTGAHSGPPRPSRVAVGRYNSILTCGRNVAFTFFRGQPCDTCQADGKTTVFCMGRN